MYDGVLLSLHPRWVERIAYDKKLEVRKSRPLCYCSDAFGGYLDKPFVCYMYQTKAKWDFSVEEIPVKTAEMLRASGGMVVGEFICDAIDPIQAIDPLPFGGALDCYGQLFSPSLTCLTPDELDAYLDGNDGWGWHIRDVVWYDEPRYLSDFYVEEKHGQWTRMKPLERPPQSWRYVYQKTDKEGKL